MMNLHTQILILEDKYTVVWISLGASTETTVPTSVTSPNSDQQDVTTYVIYHSDIQIK